MVLIMKDFTQGVVSSITGDILLLSSNINSLQHNIILDNNFVFDIKSVLSLISLKQKLENRNLSDSFYHVLLYKYNYDLINFKEKLNQLSHSKDEQIKSFNLALSKHTENSDEYKQLSELFFSKSNSIELSIKILNSKINFKLRQINKLNKLIGI